MPVRESSGLRGLDLTGWLAMREEAPDLVDANTLRSSAQRSLRDALNGWARNVGVAASNEACPVLHDTDEECSLGSPMDTPASSEPCMDIDMEDFSGPPPCSFLRPGQLFVGTQRVSRLEGTTDEDWHVEVALQEVDMERGVLCGRSVWQLPHGKAPVVTQWEGEVIDNRNHSFLTRAWGASRASDLKHWGRFAPFGPLRKQVMQTRGSSGRLSKASHVFMRWKEQCFLDAAEDCGLTIAGFYYVCLDRMTGNVDGVYVDPHSAPNHKLQLHAASRGARGTHSSGAYQFR